MRKAARRAEPVLRHPNFASVGLPNTDRGSDSDRDRGSDSVVSRSRHGPRTRCRSPVTATGRESLRYPPITSGICGRLLQVAPLHPCHVERACESITPMGAACGPCHGDRRPLGAGEGGWLALGSARAAWWDSGAPGPPGKVPSSERGAPLVPMEAAAEPAAEPAAENRVAPGRSGPSPTPLQLAALQCERLIVGAGFTPARVAAVLAVAREGINPSPTDVYPIVDCACERDGIPGEPHTALCPSKLER